MPQMFKHLRWQHPAITDVSNTKQCSVGFLSSCALIQLAGSLSTRFTQATERQSKAWLTVNISMQSPHVNTPVFCCDISPVDALAFCLRELLERAEQSRLRSWPGLFR